MVALATLGIGKRFSFSATHPNTLMVIAHRYTIAGGLTGIVTCANLGGGRKRVDLPSSTLVVPL